MKKQKNGLTILVSMMVLVLFMMIPVIVFAESSEMSEENKTCDHVWQVLYNDNEHFKYCSACGESGETVTHEMSVYSQTYEEGPEHIVKCAVCEYSYNEFHDLHLTSIDDAFHYLNCTKCDALDLDFHRADCTNPGICSTCGTTDGHIAIRHISNDMTYYHDNEYHWIACSSCGQEGYKNKHQTWCDSPVCELCGATGVAFGTINHYLSEYSKEGHDSDYCWWYCDVCNEIASKGTHVVWCTRPNSCVYCSEENVDPKYISHNLYDVEYQYNTNIHWQVCRDCSEEISGDHIFTSESPDTCTVCGAPKHVCEWEYTVIEEPTCAAEGKAINVCSGCGETEEIVLQKVDHNMMMIESKSATCISSGYRVLQCATCGDSARYTYNAIGHTFDTTAVGNGDGTHAFVCSTCGEKENKDCQLAEYAIGDVVYKVCTVCANTIEGNAVSVIAVEDAVITAGIDGNNRNDNGEDIIPSDGILALSELVFEPNAVNVIEIPTNNNSDTIKAAVKKMFVVSMTKNCEKIQLNKGPVFIRIKLSQEEYELLSNNENMKLVMLLEDGSVAELEYGLEDDYLVIRTEEFGVFMIIDCSETPMNIE